MGIHNVGVAQLLLSCGCLKVKDSCECILNGRIWDYGLVKRNGVLFYVEAQLGNQENHSLAKRGGSSFVEFVKNFLPLLGFPTWFTSSFLFSRC